MCSKTLWTEMVTVLAIFVTNIVPGAIVTSDEKLLAMLRARKVSGVGRQKFRRPRRSACVML